MRIIRDPKKAKFKNTVVALGNFDGVHIGHRRILKSAAALARKLRTASVALTFDPHPQQVVSPERGLRLLTTLPEREKLIKGTGIDGVLVIRFDDRFRRLSYADFVKRYLIDELDARVVLVGYDYAFGRGRAGDAGHLRKLGAKLGFLVKVVKAVSSKGRPVKSRDIRHQISSGDFDEAIRLLGHPYVINGKVVRGSGRGGVSLGFPTANLSVDMAKLIPPPGVYAGVVRVKGRVRKCVVNIGNRPTFPGDGGAVEVHILRFKGNIYGSHLEVLLRARFREERQFSDVGELVEQIKRDVARASRAGKN